MYANRFFVRDVVTISPGEDLVTAAKLMRKQHVGFLVVTDPRRSGQRPLGVLSDRDIMLECVAEDLSPHDIKVADVMAANPLFTTADEDLEDLLKRMRTAGVRRAPVVDAEGDLIGVVSFDDLLQTFAAMLTNMAAAAPKQRSKETRLRA